MKKKIIALAVATALLAIAVVGGTYAYFTDHEEVDNVFTIGSVDIELIESTFHRAGAYGDGVEKTDDEIKADAVDYQDYLAEQGENIVPGRRVMKNPYVVNNGDNAAYVRIRVIVDADLMEKLDIITTQTAVNDGSVLQTIAQDGDKLVATFVYTEALEPGEMTYWNPISSFIIPTDLDNADLAAFQDMDQVIRVEADAIQAETFDSAVAAFAAFDAQN